MLRKMYLVISILFCLMFIVSCQKTPESSAVHQKEATRHEDESTDFPLMQLSENLAVPAEWVQQYEPNRKLDIDAKASITVPKVEYVSTYSIRPLEITQERASELIKCLFEDAPIYEPQPLGVTTQEDIMSQVDTIRVYLDELKVYDPKAYEEEIDEWNQLTQELLSSLSNYPETYQSKLSDGLFATIKKYEAPDMPDALNPDIETIKVQADLGEKYLAQFEIAQNESYKDSFCVFSYGKSVNASDFRLPLDEVQKPIDLDLSSDDAEEMAIEFLKTLGFSNFFLQDIFYGVYADVGYVVRPGLIRERNPYFYDLCFTQRVNNIEVSNTTPFIFADYNEQFSEGWGPEKINIYIDKNGICTMLWSNPAEIGEKIDDSVKLLDFGEIQSIILESLEYNYTTPSDIKEILKTKLYIDKIEFAYTKCLKPNSTMEYILTPCWNVYGKVQTFYSDEIEDSNNDENNAYMDFRPMGTLLTINAINGSLINTDMGY